MKRKSKYVIAAVLGLIALGACSPGNNFRDVEGVKSERPELVRNFNNMDAHPNIGMVCIEGVAFFTTTRDYTPIGRVPEWDRNCPTQIKK